MQFFNLLADCIWYKKILDGIALLFISTLLSNTGQYNIHHQHSKLFRSIGVNIFKASDIMVNDYTISDS